jgi:hypothetical protein
MMPPMTALALFLEVDSGSEMAEVAAGVEVEEEVEVGITEELRIRSQKWST